MKVTIRDNSALSAFRPLELVTYLRSTGWTEASAMRARGFVWTYARSSEEFEVDVPRDQSTSDYPRRVMELLNTLEVVERRSQLEIMSDIQLSAYDVVRFRSRSSDTADGTMSLENAVSFVHQARDVMAAAACAAVEPRPVYHTRRPAEALEYMRYARFGQTERGSFVLTVMTRVPPALESPVSGQFDLIEEPLARRVTLTLASALDRANSAAVESAATGTVTPFQQGVSEGISANLCESLAKIGTVLPEQASLEVGFTWSASRPVDTGRKMGRVLIQSDAFPMFQEAARSLRAVSPYEEFNLEGWIIRLESEDLARGGRVTVFGQVDEDFRKVQFELRDVEYAAAVSAHGDGKRVSCIGNLVKSGRTWALQEPRRFQSLDS